MYLAFAQSKNFNLKRKLEHQSHNQIKKKHYKTNYPTAFPGNYDISCSPKFCKEWSDILWCKCYNINDTDLYEYYGCSDDDSVILC